MLNESDSGGEKKVCDRELAGRAQDLFEAQDYVRTEQTLQQLLKERPDDPKVSFFSSFFPWVCVGVHPQASSDPPSPVMLLRLPTRTVLVGGGEGATRHE